MKRVAALLTAVAALTLSFGSVRATCNPEAKYELVKSAILQQEPSNELEFDKLMSKLGLVQHDGAWSCETDAGDFGAVFVGAKRWVLLTYTPYKAEKVPDAMLSFLLSQGRAEVVGPSSVRFHVRSDSTHIAALGSSAEVDEVVMIGLASGVHEGTGCTIRLGPKR